MTDWESHFRGISRKAKAERMGIADFGAEPVSVIAQVQAKLNALGYSPPLTADGNMGPKTSAAILWFQRAHELGADGILGPQTLGALGIQVPVSKSPSVTIPTVIAALRKAAAEMGYTLSDGLASLMIGQMRGAEGAYPGVGGTLGGTNNIGATQAPASLAKSKAGIKGWGAFAHLDSDPNHGPYIGWYYIAPSALEAARHWLKDNWWGPALLKANPQDSTSYSSILYRGGYFQGMHAGDTSKDPNSAAGQLNVADYARAVQRGVASQAELAATGSDPSALTVDPSKFAPLAQRKITEPLYNKAKSGGIGSAWASFLPPTWDDLVRSNGVAWFGPPPVGAIAAVTGLVYWLVGGVLMILGVFGFRAISGTHYSAEHGKVISKQLPPKTEV